MILKKIYQNQMTEDRRGYFDSFPFSLLWTEPNLNNHYHSSEFAFGSLRDEGIKRRGGAATSSLSEPKANSEERRQNIYFLIQCTSLIISITITVRRPCPEF